MSLVLEQFLTPALGDASYLIGDDSARVCAIIDPQVDTAQYIEAARRHGVAIRHVVQTHNHEDFVSGARALAREAGGAQVCLGGEDAPAYGFPHRALRDGDCIELGAIRLTVRHAPGHTPEHIALVAAKADEDGPFAVFSGGSLLAGTAGRTDLLGPPHTDELTRRQFETLRDVFLALPDGVLVYPTHVHGSPCGAAIGDRVVTTIAYEKAHNDLLRQPDAQAFGKAALANLPPKPSYYPRLKQRNEKDPPERGAPGAIAALPPQQFAQALEDASRVLVDTRHMLAFGGGHIAGALNIGAAGHLTIQAGWMLDPRKELLLVLEQDADAQAVLTHLARTGIERFAGFLAGGMTAWQNAGLPLQSLAQMHVRELAGAARDAPGTVTVLDVRAPHEWKEGHVPGAVHLFLPELPARLQEVPKDKPVAVYCDSGYRASIGASILQAHGLAARNVPGSWQAWQACGLPVEGASGA